MNDELTQLWGCPDMQIQSLPDVNGTWKRDTESSLTALEKCALMTQLPKLLCHTSRRPLCLLR